MTKTSSFYKNIITCLLVFSQVALPQVSSAQATGSSSTDLGSDARLIQLPGPLVEALTSSPLSSECRVNVDGKIYRAYFVGYHDSTTHALCAGPSSSCVVSLIGTPDSNSGSTSLSQDGSFLVIPPGNADYENPPDSVIDGANSAGSAAGSDLGDANNLNQNLDGDPDNGSPNNSLGNAIDSSVISGLSAGGTTAVALIFGNSAGLRQAEQQYTQASHDLDRVMDQRAQMYNVSAKEAWNFVQNYKVVSSLLIQSLASVQNSSVTDPFSREGLAGVLKGLDSDYQQRTLAVVDSINQNSQNILYTSVRNYRQIAQSAVYASILSRHGGLNSISEAQLQIAKKVALQMANLLYGLDPITGLHRGVYELFTGRNLITGQPLSNFQRGVSGGFAAINLLTLGSSGVVTAAIKGIATIEMAGMRAGAASLQESLRVLDGTAEVLTLDGIETGSELAKTETAVSPEIRSGETQNLDQLGKKIDSSIAEGKIKDVEFNPEFRSNPSSNDSLKYITAEVSSGTVKAVRIYPGNTKDIYIIGRKMGNLEQVGVPASPGVLTYAEALKKAHYENVHVFEPTTDAVNKFDAAVDLYRERTGIPDAKLPPDKVQKTTLWQENKQYIEKALGTPDNMPTIIDTEYTAGIKTHSDFYHDLELTAITRSGRTPWNN